MLFKGIQGHKAPFTFFSMNLEVCRNISNPVGSDRTLSNPVEKTIYTTNTDLLYRSLWFPVHSAYICVMFFVHYAICIFHRLNCFYCVSQISNYLTIFIHFGCYFSLNSLFFHPIGKKLQILIYFFVRSSKQNFFGSHKKYRLIWTFLNCL